jgi:hypothetical protein
MRLSDLVQDFRKAATKAVRVEPGPLRPGEAEDILAKTGELRAAAVAMHPYGVPTEKYWEKFLAVYDQITEATFRSVPPSELVPYVPAEMRGSVNAGVLRDAGAPFFATLCEIPATRPVKRINLKWKI